jgi:hypothetical protein
MKKIFTLCTALCFALSSFAQLAWDTEMTKADFENAQTVISKTDNVSFSNPTLGIGGGLSIGKVSIFSTFSDECVIALPQTGIADMLTFAWQGGSNGSLFVYQSPDHNNWTQIYTATGNTISSDTEVEVQLATTTRYLKFAATAHSAVVFRHIKVTELKRLSASADEWMFSTAMIDDPNAQKTFNISWTNIVAEVSSTDPHFVVTPASIGQKNLIDQTTPITVTYLHSEAGNHKGEIVIAGEGKEVRIAVSGETKKYDQTLTWIQDLDECLATDHIHLNAFTSSMLEVEYISSDSTVAYVENGDVIIVCAGDVQIAATQPGNYKYNAVEPIIKDLTIRKADPVASAIADEITYGQKLSEAVLHENSGIVEGEFTWLEVEPDSIFDAGDYVLSLLFTPTNTCAYNTRIVPVALRVNKAMQTITWEDQETELVVGQPTASTAVLTSGLPITYAFTECLLTIEDGIIMAENEGDVTVIAYHPGNQNYYPTMVIMQTFHISATVEPTAIRQLTPEQMQQANKWLHAGKVYISFGGRVYDAQGKLIE